MERWHDCVAVVTGASSGIGAVIAGKLVKAGLIVVALARRVELIEEMKTSLAIQLQQKFYALQCDVSKETSVNEAFDWITKNIGHVDILVNNAGCMRPGQLCTMSIAQIREMIDTNVMGVVSCTQRAFESMRERNFAGHVVIINSALGRKVPCFPNVLPDFNIYPASKFALSAVTEIYRQEFAGLDTKIKVTSISPGVVDTAIIGDDIKEMLKEAILNPEDVADAVLYAIGTPAHVQVHEIVIKPIGEMF